jgi:predicted transglutaminase-like cysteine proteinase
MDSRLAAMALALGTLTIADSATAQTVVGAASDSERYNRLRDFSSRSPAIFAPHSPNVFGTAAVGAGVTFYDARFRRVSTTDRTHPLVLSLAEPLRALSPDQQLESAQRAVLQRVRWSHDLDNMKVADFWSNAGETLERGAGDSEDIAIATMQVLRAAGWDARDLYVSIGRHRKLGQHIVLLARMPSGFMMLDDKIGRPVGARDLGQFTPVLTVGQGRSWVHGHRRSSGNVHAAAR